jgi:hypothetical protein
MHQSQTLFQLLIPAETVEKLQKYDFVVYNYLTLLHPKLEKRAELGFFDSFAMKMQISEL